MCVTIPYRVIELLDPMTAVVTRRGTVTTVSLLAADAGIAPGDWVLVHSGLVLSRLSDADVQQLDDLAIDGGLT